MAGRGEVRFRLVAEVEGVKKALDEVKGQISSLGNEMAGRLGPAGSVLSAMGPAGLAAAAGVGAVVGAAAAAAGAMQSLASGAMAYADAIEDTAARTGISSEALQELKFAADLTGSSMETAAAAIGKMQRALVETPDAFNSLGLSALELRELAPEDQFAKIAAALSALSDPAARAAKEVEIFGKSGTELNQLILKFEELRDRAHEVGAVMDGETTAALGNTQDSVDEAGKAWDAFKNQLGAIIVVGLDLKTLFTDLASGLGEMTAGVREFAKTDLGGQLGEIAKNLMTGGLSSAFQNIADARFGNYVSHRGAGNYQSPYKAGFLGGDATSPDILFSGMDGELKKAQAALRETEKAQRDAARAAAEHERELKKLNGTIRHTYDELVNMGPHVEDQTIYNLLEESRKRAAALTQGPAENMGYDKMRELLHAIEDQTADVVVRTTDWRGVLDEVSNVFQVLGISASSAFGKVLGGLSAGMAGLQRVKDIGGIGIMKNKSGKTDWGQTFASLGAGLQMAGAAVSIGKAIVGLFKSDPIKKAQKQAGQTLGVGISRELAEAISKQAKSLGISVQKASLLNISAAMGESGKDPRTFANQITALMKAIKDGSVPAAQGLEELGKSFTAVADAAMKAGSVGDRALVTIIKNARTAGIESPEIKAFVSEQLANAAAGISKMGGLQIVTEDDAKAQAIIFSATFWATVKEKGIIGAADAFKDSFAGLSEKLKASGFDVSAIFGPIEALMGLAGNELFRGAAEGAEGLKMALEGLANAGYLTAQSFAAFGQQADAAFRQALAGGASNEQALQTIAPLLGSIISASRNYGIEIDSNTQALIDQARAAGISFPTEPLEKVAGLLELIAEKMGATADEIGRATGNMDNFGRSVGQVNAEVGTGVGVPGREGMAGTGGPVGTTTNVTINYAPSTQIEGAGNEASVLQFVTEGLRNNAEGLRSLFEGVARGAF